MKASFHDKFTIKDLRHVHYFLGSQFEEEIYPTQRKYFHDMLNEVGSLRAKLEHVPLPSDTCYLAEEGELLKDAKKYCRLVGKLLYLNFTMLI